MKRALLCLTLSVLALHGTVLADVASVNANHKIAVHVIPHGTTCGTLPSFASCSDIHSTYAGTGDIDVIPVFYDLTAYTVLEFGLTWPVEWGAMDFTRCAAELVIGGITNPGDGLAAAWTTCQHAGSVAAGYGWLEATGPGRIALVPNVTGDYGVAACSEDNCAYDHPRGICNAGVGGVSGDDPCFTTNIYYPLKLVVGDGMTGGCAAIGDTLTYTLSFNNTTNFSAVHNVLLADSLPEGATFLSASSGGTYDELGHVVTWQIGTLDRDAAGSKTVRVLVDMEPPATLANTCRISSDEAPDTVAARNTPVCAQTHNALSLSVGDGLGGGCTYPGDSLTYTLSFDNKTNSQAVANVTLADTLPQGTEFVSASSEGVYDALSHSVTWQIGTLAQDATGSRTLMVTVQVEPPATITNTCRIAAGGLPPTVAARNTCVRSLTYSPLNLTVYDGVVGGCTYRGDSLTYTLTFNNSANAGDVHNVTLSDTLPQGTQFVSATSGGIYDAVSHCITWQIGTLASNATGARAVKVRIEVDPPVTITNACRIDGDEVEASTTTKNTDVCVFTYSPLNLTVSDGLTGCAYRGDSLTYTLRFNNNANARAVHGVTLSDTLPQGTQFVSASSGGIYDATSHTVTWQIGTLASSATGSRTVKVRVDLEPPVTIPNMCVIDGDEVEATPASENTDICVFTYSPLNLSVGDGLAGGCTYRGDSLTYTLSFNNKTNSRAVTNVTLSDTLPQGTQFISASSGGTYDAASHTVTWQIGTLASNATGSRTVKVRIDLEPPATIPNTCVIDGNEVEATLASKSTGVCVLTYSALTLSKTTSAGSCVTQGANLTYTISYSNSPNSHAVHELVLTDSLPALTDFVSATGGGVYDQGARTVIWSLGTLAGKAAGSRQVTIKVNGPLGSSFTNVCHLASVEAPPSDASKTFTVCSQEYVALTLTKTASVGDCVYYGSNLTYTLSYSNAPNGKSVHGAVLTDNLPLEGDFVSASGGGVYNSGARTVTWSLDTLAAGASGSRLVTVNVRAPAGEYVMNTCSLSSNEAPPSNASKALRVCTPGGSSLNKIAVHIKAHPTACIKGYPAFANCAAITYTYQGGGDIDAFPVFYDLNGYIVTECGMTWPEASWGSGSWTLCKGDLSIGSITHSAENPLQDATCGVVIAWSTCQSTFAVAPGFVWLSATTPARICPAPSGNGGAWGIVDCRQDPVYWMTEAGFCAGVLGMAGDDPCVPSTRVQPTTWGSIKAMFK